MFSSTRSHSSFLIWPRPPESLGSEREIGAVLLGGELRERSQSNITLGDEGLYPVYFGIGRQTLHSHRAYTARSSLE